MLMDHEDKHVEIRYETHQQSLRLIVKAKTTLYHARLAWFIPMPFRADVKIGANGFQTWTESTEYSAKEKPLALSTWTKGFRKKYHLEQYGDAHFTADTTSDVRVRSYTYIYFKVDGQTHLWASLDETDGLTTFETLAKQNQLRISKDLPAVWEVSEEYALSILVCIGDYAQVWDAWKSKLAFECRSVRAAGWTSWYQYYTHISPSILRNNLQSLKDHEIPIDYFQIDDGWQKAVGNWSCNAKFEGEMESIVKAIMDAGYTPGLWFAPFIAEEAADIPLTWFLKDEAGQRIVAGFSPDWSGNFYCLDWSQDAVKQHIHDSLERMMSWGFRFFKIDFLYALSIQVPAGTTRGQYLRKALQWLIDLAPEVRWLACGVPLASAAGITDFCRVSADISPKWEDPLLARIIRYPERVSTLSALRSSLQRAMLDGFFFNNDPDVAILREGTRLTATQRKTLFLVNQVVGSLQFISDDISEYTAEMMALYKSQFPLVDIEIGDIQQSKKRYTVDFSAGGKSFVLMANLSAKPWKELKPYEAKVSRILSEVKGRILACDDHLFPGISLEIQSLGDHIKIEQRGENFIKASTLLIEMPKDFKPSMISLKALKVEQSGDKQIGLFSL